MREEYLDESVTITLDGSGNGALTIGPTNEHQWWIPTYMTCNVSSNVKEPTFSFYLGRTITVSARKGGTYTGSQDTTDINGIILHPNEVLTCQWTGGDANATASISMGGKKLIM